MQEYPDFFPDCIDRIARDALNSAAVDHRYLDALQNGALPNMRLALQDFAFQYGFYNSRFVEYVTAVIENASTEKHRKILAGNVAEEKGGVHEPGHPDKRFAGVSGVPHSELYNRFQIALGIDDEYRSAASPAETVLLWRQQFLALCQLNEYVGIGAIGIGTELLVSEIYSKLLAAIKSHTALSAEQYIFFDLHSVCDKEHASQILLISKDLAVNRQACEQIEYGAKMAVQMRLIFWDKMYERALQFPGEAMPDDNIVNYGY